MISPFETIDIRRVQTVRSPAFEIYIYNNIIRHVIFIFLFGI